ncbi:MAG: outer membrane beta-barrel protein [Cyclobacteriaceae bacterium]
MDNKDFDKKIQEKLSQLSPPYDPQAWSALNYRLDLLAPMPWYARWKSALLVSALGLFTLVNLAILWQIKEDKKSIFEVVNSGQAEGQGQTITVYDTVQIYEHIGSNTSSPESSSFAGNNKLGSLGHYSGYPNYYASSVPSVVVAAPSEVTNDYKKAAAYYYELLNKMQLEKDQDLRLLHNISTLETINPLAAQPETMDLDFEERYLYPTPVIVRKERKPLNLRTGLSSGLLIPDPDIGERFLSSRVSVMFETPIKRDFYLHTGINFQRLTYKLDDVDDEQFDQSDLQGYPDFNTFTETPDRIRTDNTLLQIPLYLRYYGSLNDRWSVYLGGGPTLDLLLQQKFTYSFITIKDNRLEEFDRITNTDRSTINLGSIGGEFGIAHNFTRQFSGQIGLNYQYGIGKLGLEKRSFNSLTFNAGVFYQIGKR